MSCKTITSIHLYWKIAPTKLKEFVKHQICQNGYGNDLTGEYLRAQIYECEKWFVSIECCCDLIKHYKVNLK